MVVRNSTCYTIGMDTLTSLETANLFGISREAVRSYCVEFERYFEPAARPPKGRQRMFSYNDLSVIAKIVELKGQGKVFEDIHLALANDERGTVPEPMAAIAPLQQPTELALQARITDLEAELVKERALRNKAEGQVELLEKQLEKLQERLFRREW